MRLGVVLVNLLMVEKRNKYKADPTPGGISHTIIGDPRPPGDGPGEHSRDLICTHGRESKMWEGE